MDNWTGESVWPSATSRSIAVRPPFSCSTGPRGFVRPTWQSPGVADTGAHESKIESKPRQPMSVFQLVPRGDPLGGYDVRAVSAILAERRRSAVCTWYRLLPRDRTLLVEPVRSDVCRAGPPSASFAQACFRHWQWHLDEMYVKLNGEMVYLWRAVDHEGEILACSPSAPMAQVRGCDSRKIWVSS